MLNFSHRLKFPPQHKFHPLQQVTCQLDMANIGRVSFGTNIVVLQETSSIEIIHKAEVLEMLMHFLALFFVDLVYLVGHSLLGEIGPL